MTMNSAGSSSSPSNGPSARGPQPIRILVVDDSAFMRKSLAQLIESDPQLKVIDTASNGVEAVEKTKALEPDVVTLDIEMPVLNGHEALRRIRRECRTLKNGLPAVLVCSSLTTEGSRDALAAMREGAADVIAKDSSNYSSHMGDMREDLIAKIKAIAQSRRSLRQAALGVKKDFPPFESQPVALGAARVGIVVIGSSTGGPPVLEGVLKSLAPNVACPIVVAQHMPVAFTRALSERLNQTCQVRVEHAEHGTQIRPSTAYIIPGGAHGHLVGSPGDLRLEVRPDPASETYRPSTNVLFSTATSIFGRAVLGIVLTGMGEDGKHGGMRLLQAGGRIFAQDPMSSVVYGMPKAAAQIGATIMTPEHIAQSLRTLPSAILGARTGSAGPNPGKPGARAA